MSTTFWICNCNRTMPLDAAAGAKLGEALGSGPLPVANDMCRRGVERIAQQLQGSDRMVVGCTQERTRFAELGRQQNTVAPLRFVNLRETANWGDQSLQALAKTAALLADAALPEADPVPSVSYRSAGSALIIGSAAQALYWAEQLDGQLQVSVLLSGAASEDACATHAAALPHGLPEGLPAESRYPVFSGVGTEIGGWLGEFEVTWQQANPIDLEACVRCNACIAACPEGAIDTLYQVDSDACRRHGECVAACGPVRAIDFARGTTRRTGRFDLVLDLSPAPLIALHQPPQGYFFGGADPAAQMRAVLRMTQMVGEFEKPKYFRYKEKLCAHGRNRKTGCNACIEVCSAAAIDSAGDRIRVNPQLCVGCGACTTVCPSGALGYGYPDAPYLGRRLQTMLGAYARAQGRQPALLFHSNKEGAALLARLGRLAQTSKWHRGLPARLIPVDVEHVASVGIDLWLAAVASGATNVAVLATGAEAPQYLDALAAQMAIGQTILNGLGYAGAHLRLIRAATPDELDAALAGLQPAQAPAQPATFHVAADKRNTLDFVFDHLHRHAPAPQDHIALPGGAPFGALAIDTSACTLCMSCVGACPESALMDSKETPQLRFVEKNCVQCGLCVKTCPEQAIALVPRISFTHASRNPVVLAETQPFHCIRCSKPFGTLQMVEAMISRLAGHGAFSAHPERLRMCGDCRVVDMMNDQNEMAITNLRRGA